MFWVIWDVDCSVQTSDQSDGYAQKWRTLAIYQGRSQDFFRGTHNLTNSVGNNWHPPPPPAPKKPLLHRATARQTFMTDEASHALRGGLGACSPRKCWNLEALKCCFRHCSWGLLKWGVVFGNLQQFLYSLVGRMILILSRVCWLINNCVCRACGCYSYIVSEFVFWLMTYNIM